MKLETVKLENSLLEILKTEISQIEILKSELFKFEILRKSQENKAKSPKKSHF